MVISYIKFSLFFNINFFFVNWLYCLDFKIYFFVNGVDYFFLKFKENIKLFVRKRFSFIIIVVIYFIYERFKTLFLGDVFVLLEREG